MRASLRCMNACTVSFLLVPCVLVSCALLFWLVSIRIVHHALLSPRHDLGAHLLQTSLGLAVREKRNSLNGLVNVVLRQCARLLEPVACQYDITGLQTISPSFSQNTRHICSKLTFCASPGSENLRPTSLPSSALSFQANNSGAVASPSSKSAPAGLPSSAPEMV
jgi:hypothetical protein